MQGFIEVLVNNNPIRPYYKHILILILIIIFAYAAYYGYNTFYASTINKMNDVANVTEGNIATVYIFHVDWCPHCVKAMPEWKKFVSKYNGSEVNGYIVNCVDINCTKETIDVKAAIEKYDIESYPTIKLVKDNKIIEFDSRITDDTLEQFVNTML
jgi:thiol-disulfide isomerase/thioredoxin